MKRIGNLMENITTLENITRAHQCARKDKSHRNDVHLVDLNVQKYAERIKEMLDNETYEVNKYKTSIIEDKGKRRVLYKLPYFPDRIIQWAILLQIEDQFLKVFTPYTCASIKDRGVHYASKMLREWLANDPEGTKFGVKLDIKKYYPSVDRKILKKMLRKIFKDKKLLRLLDKIIDSFASADISHLKLTEEEKKIYSRKGKGIPVGSYLSQYLANFYLAYFDHWLKEVLKCKYVIRYMDDIIILSDSKEKLFGYIEEISRYLKENLELEIKSNWQVFPVDERGIDFVGYRHFHGYVLLRKRVIKRCKKTMIRLHQKFEKGIKFSYSEFCSYISYIGWLSWCDGYDFFMKYCAESMGPINMYFTLYIEKDIRKHHHILINKQRFKRCVRQHHVDYKYVHSHRRIHKKGVLKYGQRYAQRSRQSRRSQASRVEC